MLGEFDELPPSDQFPVVTGEPPLHFCGIKEEFRLDGKLYPIPELVWTWWFHGSIPGWSNDKTEAVIQKAISTWSKVCRLRFKQASTRDSANVLITTERIDGPQGVLADAQLYTGQRQQKLRFDLEKYVDTLRPGPGYIGFPHVTAHEWGHIIAFPHLDFDGTPDLMNRTYNPDIHEPQADEASIALKLFGAPDATPPEPPKPELPKPIPGSKPVRVTIEQDGKQWAGEISRIK